MRLNPSLKKLSFLDKIKSKIFQKFNYRDRARLTSFQGNSNNVLQCCIAYNKYGGYCIPLSSLHRPAVQQILSGAVWEMDTIEFMISHCGEGDIVHAGTFYGDFLPALSQSSMLGSKVWAFEPNPENYRCALITVHINGLQNIELMNVGLGESYDQFVMETLDARGRSRGGASRIVETNTKSPEKGLITVNIAPLDEIIPLERNVSIIQLDVEGFEKSALTGALKTIQRCRPILILENLPQENWLSENILQLGYRIVGKIHRNTILRVEH